MQTRALALVLMLGVAGGSLSPRSTQGKTRPTPTPPPSAKASETAPAPPAPAPSAGSASDGTATLVRWLAEQKGGSGAVTLPLGQVIQGATGAVVVPLDRKDPKDAELIALIGGALDAVLPLMNKPDSPAHNAADAEKLAAVFEAALREKLQTAKDFTLETSPTANPPAPAPYPAFTLSRTGGSRTYCLGVSTFAASAPDSAAGAFFVRPSEAAALKLGGNTACLLVAVETNGKTGKEAAFLNWELLDASKLPVRALLTFEGPQGALHSSTVRLDDGRKGRD